MDERTNECAKETNISQLRAVLGHDAKKCFVLFIIISNIVH